MSVESGSCPLLGDSVHRKVVTSYPAAAGEGNFSLFVVCSLERNNTKISGSLLEERYRLGGPG